METSSVKRWAGKAMQQKTSSTVASTQTSVTARNADIVSQNNHTHNVQMLAPPIDQLINASPLEKGSCSFTRCRSKMVVFEASTSTCS